MTLKRMAIPSGGNVFADLGVSQPAVALAKAKLARQISRIIGERQFTQVAAAKVLGVDQGKVSALLRGRLTGFSTERLFKFLNALDHDIEIVVKKRPRSRRRTRVADATAPLARYSVYTFHINFATTPCAKRYSEMVR